MSALIDFAERAARAERRLLIASGGDGAQYQRAVAAARHLTMSTRLTYAEAAERVCARMAAGYEPDDELADLKILIGEARDEEADDGGLQPPFMPLNQMLAELGGIASGRSHHAEHPGTEVVVRCGAEEYPVDCIQLESFPGNEHEPAREVVAIRIEPEDERDGQAIRYAFFPPAVGEWLKAFWCDGAVVSTTEMAATLNAIGHHVFGNDSRAPGLEDDL